MRCSGSPTTCIAAEPPPSSQASSGAREAAVRFEAILFKAALEPLVKPLGFFGDVALDGMALSLARRERALAATFERLLR